VMERVKDCLEAPRLPDEQAWAALGSRAGTFATAALHVTGQYHLAGAEEPWVGRTIGQYVILELIRHGGLGVVYKARPGSVDGDVALKMVLAGVHAGGETLARFRTEAKAAARLKHPNIVPVYDSGEQDRLPYYSMELVEGGSLASRLADGPLGAREAAE